MSGGYVRKLQKARRFNVYLSGSLEQKSKLKIYGKTLVKRKFNNCASWLKRKPWMFKEQYNGQDSLLQQKLATLDYADIIQCDLFLIPFGSEVKDDVLVGVELGLALWLKKRVLVVGERFCQYCYLPQVEFFETWQECLDKVFPYVENKTYLHNNELKKKRIARTRRLNISKRMEELHKLKRKNSFILAKPEDGSLS